MKKIYLLCLLLSGISTFTFAQDIEPGEQAKGMTQIKNTSVDYSTGIFSYHIPFFELSSGDYKLPVGLSYSTSGIKVDDIAGICGYGWNLQCGGVVTRVVRGGFPDEDYRGYAFGDPFTVTDVNKHTRDGECDIFTAVFNGRQIHFVLHPKSGAANNELQAVPLNATDVKIDPVDIRNISMWRITDENGIVYIFSEKEITTQVGIESGVSSNSASPLPYTSSWYLTEIKIPSAPKITFEYSNFNDNPRELKYQKYQNFSRIYYHYGKPIIEYSYNLDPYKEELRNLTYLANTYAQSAKFNIRIEALNTKISEFFDLNLKYIQDAKLESATAQVRFIDKCMGYVNSIEYLSVASQGIINSFNDILASLPQEGYYIESLRSVLYAMKDIYLKSLIYVRNITFRKSGLGKHYKIAPKYLTKVRCDDKIVSFGYIDGGPYKQLKTVRLSSYLQHTISEIDLIQGGGGLLNKITFRGEEKDYQTQEFDYYGKTQGGIGADVFGYYNGSLGDKMPFAKLPFLYTPKISFEFEKGIGGVGDGYVWEEHTKKYSLKSIKTHSGVTVKLDYINNYIGEPKYGGIRISSMVIEEGAGQSDTIRYLYLSGKSILTGWNNGKILDYGSFRDIVLFGKARHHEIGIINCGNNGVMYDYVIEDRVGGGKTAYYYYIPDHANEIGVNDLPEVHPYWLYGIPLGKIEYDREYRKVSLSRNKYYATIPPEITDNYPEKFIDKYNVPFPYQATYQQIKPFDFYMDYTEQLINNPNYDITLFQDDNNYYCLNPYYHIFLPNIAPRCNLDGPEQVYYLYLGGKVLLKEQEEYIFEYNPDSPGISSPVYRDFFSIPQNTFKSMLTHYEYGPNHTLPIHVVQEKNDGTRIDTYSTRVKDVAGGEYYSIVQEMKSQNIVAPVLMERTYITEEELTVLASEKITEYTGELLNNENIYVVKNIYESLNNSVEREPPTQMVNQISFSDNIKDYRISHFDYDIIGGKVNPKRIIKSNTPHVYVYDKGNGKPILKATGLTDFTIDAFNRIRQLEPFRGISYTYEDTPLFNSNIKSFYSVFKNYITYFELIEKYFQKTSDMRCAHFFTSYSVSVAYWYCTYLLNSWSYEDFCSIRDRDKENYNRDKCIEELRVLVEKRVLSSEQSRQMLTCLDIITALVGESKEVYEDMMGVMNNELTGRDIDKKLYIEVGDHDFYNCTLVIKNRVTIPIGINYKIRYKDHTSVGLEDEVYVTHTGWNVCKFRLNMDIFPDREDIHSLEVTFTLDEATKDGEFYGAILGVLAPVGVEYEAISKDHKGRVICKLNHLNQLERYEYDSFGRVKKIFDAFGNLRKEIEYNRF